FHLVYGRDSSGNIFSINPYQLALDQGEHPYRNGYQQGYGLNASGGSDVLQYYAGGQFDHETGTDQSQRLATYSGRVNLGITPNAKLNINTSVGYLRGHWQVPNDGNFGGPLFAFWGIRPSLLNTPRQGWLFGSPDQWNRG